MNRILLVLKLGALVGLSMVEPLYHLVHHEVHHQDHESHEEGHHLPEKRKAAMQNL